MITVTEEGGATSQLSVSPVAVVIVALRPVVDHGRDVGVLVVVRPVVIAVGVEEDRHPTELVHVAENGAWKSQEDNGFKFRDETMK